MNENRTPEKPPPLMDIGSSSFGGSSASASAGGGGSASPSPSPDSSSLNGLKFGKKIYFEDVGIGVSTKSGGGSSSVSVTDGVPATSTARKGRGGGLVQGGQPPRCQVEGCRLDLSDVKAYYSRHKVCAMHSKSPKVIVGGLEQRFCQQCSRFHQLPEFDQGKRSCRRRLAGHNERRRKPQPGSMMSSRYGRIQESSSRVGSFLMDFTAYPRVSGRDAWPTIRAGNWATSELPTAKLHPHQWQDSSVDPPQANVFSHSSHPYHQDSAGGTVFSSSRVPPGECFAGVTDSGCALSLLSNQSWAPRNQTSSLSVNNLMTDEGAPMAQTTAPPHGAVVNIFTTNAWSYKSSPSSHELSRDVGVTQVSQPINNQFSGEFELPQQASRQYMELAHSRAYDSSPHQMHWSL